MTTYYDTTVKCSVCGHENQFTEMGSSNSFGSPDLDLRAPGMIRMTMGCWIQECKNCHYVSHSVSSECPVPVAFIRSAEYLDCDGYAFKSELARRFYRQHKLQLLAGNTQIAFDALLHAAWVCDDTQDKANAKIMRELCLPLVTSLISKNEKNGDSLLLMKADLLRRAGMFDELLAEYENVTFHDDIMNQVLRFQLLKAKERDDACYTVKQAVAACQSGEKDGGMKE